MKSHDDFIGSTFDTPTGSILTVVDKFDKVAFRPIKYVVECSSCSKDAELFTKPLALSKYDLKSGGLPCGCSKSPRWSKEQYKTMVLRMCGIKQCTFGGFRGKWKGVKTKLILTCNFDNNTWDTTNIDMFLNDKTSCPECGKRLIGNARRKEDQIIIESFYEAGLDRTKYTFTRNTVDKNSKGYYTFWDMKCTTCSNDMYVEAGVCSGVFTSPSNNLQQSQLPCRCAKTYQWTKTQREYQVFQVCEKENLIFLQWHGEGYKSNKSKLDWTCSEGHNCTTVLHGFLSGTRCRQCNGGHMQRQAYINVLTDGKLPYCLKYGIAGEANVRRNTQDSKSVFTVDSIGVWEFPSIDLCKRAEQVVSSCVDRPYAAKWDFPDGYTETCSIKYLADIINIYTDYGGISVKQS